MSRKQLIQLGAQLRTSSGLQYSEISFLRPSTSSIQQYSALSQEAFYSQLSQKYYNSYSSQGTKRQYNLQPQRYISTGALGYLDRFEPRHNSSTEQEISEMLKTIGCSSEEELADKTVPKEI